VCMLQGPCQGPAAHAAGGCQPLQHQRRALHGTCACRVWCVVCAAARAVVCVRPCGVQQCEMKACAGVVSSRGFVMVRAGPCVIRRLACGNPITDSSVQTVEQPGDKWFAPSLHSPQRHMRHHCALSDGFSRACCSDKPHTSKNVLMAPNSQHPT
jgi:hypothetical protein